MTNSSVIIQKPKYYGEFTAAVPEMFEKTWG
jgi:hypothetical protein